MSNTVTEFDRHYSELSIKDKDDPKSLVNMLPSVMAEKIMAIPDEVFLYEEDVLRGLAHVQLSEETMRIAFWEEYKRAERTSSKMNMNNVYAGFVTKKYFHTYIVGNSYKLAFMLLPPMEVQLALEEMVLLGLKRQRQWLAISPEECGFNPKLAAVQQRILEDILNRRRGHVLRQTEMINRNTNVNVTLDGNSKPKTLEEIEREIHELQHPTIEHNPQEESLAVAYKDVSNEKEKI